MLESQAAGDAGMLGMLLKLAKMQRMLAGMLATVRGDFHVGAMWHQEPVARPGMSGVFLGSRCWAAGDAGDGEELGVQHISSSSKTHSAAGLPLCRLDVNLINVLCCSSLPCAFARS